MLKSTEQNSSQEGINVSPINDTKWVIEFEGGTEHVAIGPDTGKADTERMDNCRWPTQYRFRMDFSWTYERHDQWFGNIDSNKTHGMTLLSNWMRDKWISQTGFKWWIGGVMFKRDTYCQSIRRWKHIPFPNFPPPFLASTSLFLHKLEEDNICLLM